MEKSLGTRQVDKNNNPSKNIAVGRRVMNAIQKLQGQKGISLQDLKKYLRDEKNMDLEVYGPDVKLALKSGVDKGILSRESGNYMVREAKRRRSRSRSKGRRSKRRRSSRRRRSRSRGKRSGSRRRRRPRRRKKSVDDE